MFRSFQIIIREFRRSLLKLLHIHDLIRFCKVVQCSWLGVRRMLSSSIRRTPSQLHSLQQIPTQHDMLPQHLLYKHELNREYVITLATNYETP